MKYVLGYDCGSTTAKAALYDMAGKEIAVAGRPQDVASPMPGAREMDPELVWKATSWAISEVIARAGIDARDIVGVGGSGYGNGVFTLTQDGKPVRPGFLSSDRRAMDIMEEWQQRNVPERIAPLTLQMVFPGEMVTCLAWIKKHEPENYRRIAHIVPIKNYVTFRLTGEYATDLSDISGTGLMDKEWRYNEELLEIYGIPEMWPTLPPVRPSHEVIGTVQPDAAAATGLVVGTPVVTGLHDMSACPLGSGAINPGDLVSVIGTFGFNEIILEQSADCSVRFAIPGLYFTTSGAAGARNLEWFVVNCCGEEAVEATSRGISVYEVCNEKVEAAMAQPMTVFYHPYLWSSFHLPNSMAGFYGITNTTTKGQLLRAIYEGVVFAQLDGLNDLKSWGFTPKRILLSGGGAKSRVWSQMFADAYEMPISIAAGSEHGAHGAAMCAGIGAGLYADYKDAVQKAITIEYQYQPDPSVVQMYRDRHSEFVRLGQGMLESWARLTKVGK